MTTDNNQRQTSTAYLTGLVLIICALFFSNEAFGQFSLRPLPAPKYEVKKHKANARVQADSILGLPFWDDFTTNSKDLNGNPIPNEYLWQNSLSVRINNSMAYNQPTVNVATFDGLDSVYNAYNTSVLVAGLSDKLESRQFDLSPYKFSADSGTIYLSFFYQWKGRGEAPDKNDFIRLDYMDVDSIWRPIQTYYPGDDLDETKFIYTNNKVDTAYQHKNFHFRIIRYGKNTGAYDTWNVDYVYMHKGRSATAPPFFFDIAVSSEITPFFKQYGSIPLQHLSVWKNDVVGDLGVKLNNQRGQEAAVSQGAFLESIKRYKNDTTTFKKDITLSAASTFLGQKNEILNINTSYNESDLFDTLAEEIDLHLRYYIASQDLGSGHDKDFAPFNVLKNDTVNAYYHLADYYAHDDGGAEYAAVILGKGNIGAQRFDLLKGDSLTGVEVYFPNYGGTTTQNTRIVVYDMKDSLPNNAIIRRMITVPKSSLNKFTRITFGRKIVSGSIFIGWEEQSATDPVRVGIDYGNNPPNITYEYKNTVWQRSDRVHGSLMVRPVFGQDTSTVTGVETSVPSFRIYPNPTEGTVFIEGAYDNLNVISLTGQAVAFTEEQLAEKKRITVHASAGLYLIKLQVQNKVVTRKILIR